MSVWIVPAAALALVAAACAPPPPPREVEEPPSVAPPVDPSASEGAPGTPNADTTQSAPPKPGEPGYRPPLDPPWIGVASRGECSDAWDRPAKPPRGIDARACAARRGCPAPPNGEPIARCPSALEVVSVRALREEHGTRPRGSAIAVRGTARTRGPGIALRKQKTEEELGAEAAKAGRLRPCTPRPHTLTLTTEDTGVCQGVPLQLAPGSPHLVCHGDITDNCCHANPALPPLNEPAVAIGRYLGVHWALDRNEVDVVEVDSFCLPAPAPKAPLTP